MLDVAALFARSTAIHHNLALFASIQDKTVNPIRIAQNRACGSWCEKEWRFRIDGERYGQMIGR
jgi:hypothetical protein